MAVLLIEREADLQLWSDEGGGATLDDVLSGAWDGLAAAAVVRVVPRVPRRARAALVGRFGRGRRSLRRLRVVAELDCAPHGARRRAELARLEQEWMEAMQARDRARLDELVAPASASPRSISAPSR